MKLANPLYYPLTVAAGGVVLVLTVRFANFPIALAMPISAAIATSGAIFLKRNEPETIARLLADIQVEF